ncbi:MAG: methyltransferase domain-containing protein [Candidatus Binatus sp.]|uniref:class I SAM-dependent methyltransferase n=1 Tax=Candidatus Binatus sp. TaxID=2811406 RepID=UPI00271E5501|nr:methyltransferase domain-containing protein [Candidatus Binatus sp.]MDO8432156.1 methyltransferase domain-containing protein [Candidatus Binatus sp.]
MSNTQSWSPEKYAENARFVSDLGAPVVELLAPKAGEKILDLGCGDGALTIKLAAMGCNVIGVDSSAPQIAGARKLGLDARVVDGERLEFGPEFDAVFSNAAIHWMKRADDVITGVWRALRPGGRFVGEFGGAGCVDTIKRALVEALGRRGIDGEALNPWYFPTAEDYRARLERRGFAVRYIALIPRPTPLPTEINGWLETFAQSFMTPLKGPQRGDFIAEVREALRPKLCDSEGKWFADYIRLRFAADKPKA